MPIATRERPGALASLLRRARVATYGVPTKVVALCAASVTVTREFDTATGASAARLLVADVS